MWDEGKKDSVRPSAPVFTVSVLGQDEGYMAKLG